MRVCDWIAEFLYNYGIQRVHGLMGGGASGLNDGFIKNKKIEYICYHHEQGAGHSAIGESKYTGKLSVVNPTTGCGGTNCATSVLNAWQDSVPVLFLSGNVKLATCSHYINESKNINLRKYGVQEHHIVDTFKTMTKYSKFITNASEVSYEISKAIHIATSDRPGPVWIDIPSDIQVAPMTEYNLFSESKIDNYYELYSLREKMYHSKRPIILAGYGIRQSNTVNQFVKFIEKYNIPYVSTYGARDYTSHDHYLNLGAIGIKGSRAGNFAVQNSDFLLILGSSIGSSVIGYDPKQFSPYSYKIMVDCDKNELDKEVIKIDEKYNCTLQSFFGELA
jgi:acetolactate synthase-1/2/3 large subunit